MKKTTPIKGPEIIWNAEDTQKMIDKHGKIEATRIIAGTTLQIPYVTYMISVLIK